MHDSTNKAGADNQEDRKSIVRWQENLLPFLQRIVLLLILAFLVVSAIETVALRRNIYNDSGRSLAQSLEEIDRLLSKDGHIRSSDDLRWYTLVALEEQVIARRYGQARSLLLFSIYTRFLGFYTGMILALVGALFVLGKIEDSGSEIQIDGAFGRAMARGTPGIILAVLGTVLMITTIVKEFEIQVTDMPLFVGDRRGEVVEKEDAIPIVVPPIILPNVDPKKEVKR